MAYKSATSAVGKFKDATKLTPKQRKFAEEYIIDFNGARAALAAGYSKSTAKTTAHHLMHHPIVTALIQKKMDARSKRTEIDADYVLKTIKETTDALVAEDPIKYAHQIFKGTELLGKHLKLFTEKVELSGKVSLEALINESNRDLIPEKKR